MIKNSGDFLRRGLIYQKNFLSAQDLDAALTYFRSIQPIWEMRFSKSNPPPEGTENRKLLRPVYWLGNWQFACLNYYHPPRGIDFRCVEAEGYPEVLDRAVQRIEQLVRSEFSENDIPKRWHLNTCLINYYGSVFHNSKWDDVARVGEHKDFEPGPVASLSFGDNALFQFVESQSKRAASRVVQQMWLEHNSLQIFGGDYWKKKVFHRVQRVEKKANMKLGPHIEGFQTRRINLTFRYVPTEHVQPLIKFPNALREDVKPYILELAKNSQFFDEVKTENFATI